MRHLVRVYGPIDEEAFREHAMGPLRPGQETGEALVRAGTLRNLMRWAEEDGMRCVGALLPFLEPGEDPVRVLLRALSEAGYDVGGNATWAAGDGGDEG